MKTTLLSAFLVFFIFAACNKDKFESKPQLKLKSVNTKFVTTTDELIAQFEFTDKEGDVDDTLYVIRKRLNRRGIVTSRPSGYKVPTFGSHDKGEIQVNLNRTDLTFNISPISIPGTGRNENDTLNLGFVLKDKAKNTSDTVTITNVVVTR